MTTTNTDKTTLAKRNLELVTQVQPKPYGPEGAKTLWKFGAVDQSLPEDHQRHGKAIGFTTFSVSLKEHLEGLDKGAFFLGDYEVKPRPDKPEFGPDITLIQIWVDGKPLHQKSPGGGGGRGGGRSLADDLALEAVKRRSIEGQTAADKVMSLLLCDRPLDKDKFLSFGKDTGLGIAEADLLRIVGKAWQVIERQLDNYLDGSSGNGKVQGPPESPRQPRQRAPTPEAAPSDPAPTPAGPEVVAVPGKEVGVEIKNVGQLFAAALKLDPPMPHARVMEVCGVKAPSEIANLGQAWDAVLVAYYGQADESSEAVFERLGQERKVTP